MSTCTVQIYATQNLEEMQNYYFENFNLEEQVISNTNFHNPKKLKYYLFKTNYSGFKKDLLAIKLQY